MIFHIFMVILGLIIIGFGLWAIHYRSGIMEKIGGLLAPLGLIIALLGALLLAVPGFFADTTVKDIIEIFFPPEK